MIHKDVFIITALCILKVQMTNLKSYSFSADAINMIN